MNPLILYNNIIADATLSSSSLASGFDVQNIKDQRPYTFCKFVNPGAANYILIELGAVTGADTLFVCGHNLKTVGASIKLQRYTGSAYADVTGAALTPLTDYAFMLHFSLTTATKYKLIINNTLGLPYIGVVFLGVALEMQQTADGPRAPFEESISADVADSKTGNMLGASVNYNPISINHTYSTITRAWVQSAIIPFWNYAKQMNKFAYAVDLTNEADAVFLCRFKKDHVYSTPTSSLLYYDTLQLNLDAER